MATDRTADPATSDSDQGAGGRPGTPSQPLILLDGMSLAFRAYFALPPDLATKAGVVTNAVHGFSSMVVNLIRDHRPVGLAVAFDLPGGTFRDDLVDEYKGGRAETPPDLPPQFDMIRDVLGSLAIPVVGAEGYEADDVLATLATEARDRGHPVIIVTGDRDSYQFGRGPLHPGALQPPRGERLLVVRRGRISNNGPGCGPTGTPCWPHCAVIRRTTCRGYPAWGRRRRPKLINEYGDLESLYDHLDALSPKLRENLALHRDRVLTNAKVIPLVRDVPLAVHVDQLRLGGWNHEEARETFENLELRSLWTRFSTLMDEGALGQPAEGGGPVGRTGAPSARPPADGQTTEAPIWLSDPEVTVAGTRRKKPSRPSACCSTWPVPEVAQWLSSVVGPVMRAGPSWPR